MAHEAIGQLIARLSHQPELHQALRLTQDGQVVGRFYEFDLASGFQRIVRLDDHQVIGHDAYARSYGLAGDAISPWGLFARAAEDVTVVQLDRLCRLVHTINYFSQAEATTPLYLRVHGRLLAAITQDHGKAFRRMVDALALASSQIVLQLPLEAANEVLLIGVIIGNYQKAGFRVGVHAPNIAVAQSLINLHRPQVVKIDARTLGSQDDDIRALVKTAEDHGSQLVFNRIETSETAERLAHLGARFGQGYHFDLPAARLSPASSAASAM